jgi:prepilin-type N-terminal cleavage/methylation domain-containing protein
MKCLKSNIKGFTLIELLAVIVILAVLILVATPAVTQLMTKARVNTFLTESEEILGYIDTAYADKSLASTTTFATDGKIATPTKTSIYSYNNSTYLCMTVQDLTKENYMKKDVTSYTGIVQILVKADGSSISKISISNGTYTVVGTSQSIQGTTPTVGNSATPICPEEYPSTLS